MALRKCPDCGHDLSTSARSCPHCGRPNRSASASIGIAGILGIAIVGAGVLVWHLSSRNEPLSESAHSVPPETIVARPAREPEGLSVAVGYNRKLSVLRIENRDAYAWSHCLLSLNAHGISAGYTRDVTSIRPGITEAALLESAEFTAENGRRFDPTAEVPATVDIACDTPQGAKSYAGKFEP